MRWNGRVFEALAARAQHRDPCALYHSALQVELGPDCWSIEMAPVWSTSAPERGAVCEGPVGLPLLGRSRLSRYEVRRWREGVIPDLESAVLSPQVLSDDAERAQRVLDLVPDFPPATWGRDELRTGDMWNSNSNSLVSWLLVRSGHDPSRIAFPPRGRAPGWSAGQVVGARQQRGLPA